MKLLRCWVVEFLRRDGKPYARRWLTQTGAYKDVFFSEREARERLRYVIDNDRTPARVIVLEEK